MYFKIANGPGATTGSAGHSGQLWRKMMKTWWSGNHCQSVRNGSKVISWSRQNEHFSCKILKQIFSKKKFWDAGHRTLIVPNAVQSHSPLGHRCSYHSLSSRGLELRGEWMQWTRERAHNFYRKMPRAPYSRTQGSVALLKYIFLVNFLLSFEWYRTRFARESTRFAGLSD